MNQAQFMPSEKGSFGGEAETNINSSKSLDSNMDILFNVYNPI